MADKSERKAIELGDIVRDTISGFEGVAVARTEWMHNCPRFTVQGKGIKDGQPIDPVSFDEMSLEFVKKSDLEVLPVARPKEIVMIGDEVIDELTGLEGVAIGHTVWLNGCSRINIAPRALKDGIPAKSTTVDEKDCKIVKHGKPRKTPTTGGPRADSRLPSVSARR